MDQWLKEIPSLFFGPRPSSLQPSPRARNAGLAHAASAAPRCPVVPVRMGWHKGVSPRQALCFQVPQGLQRVHGSGPAHGVPGEQRVQAEPPQQVTCHQLVPENPGVVIALP